MIRRLLAASAALSVIGSASAAITLSPMTSWGFNGDGWWAPGENGITYLANDNNQRSLAVNPVNGSVYLANALSVRVLDKNSGASVGLFNTTGITGGARALNTVGVASDGSIYAANLTTAAAATGANQFKVYKWANEAAALAAGPSNPYAGDAGLAGARIGDDLDVWGGQLAAGYSNTPAITGNNGFATIDLSTSTLTRQAFAATPPNAGDFRLSIAGVDGDTLFGTQSSGSSGRLRLADFSGGSASLTASIQLASASERGMDYAVIGGVPVLATVDTAISVVRLYDLTGVDGTTTSLTAFASLDLTPTDNANGNATSAVAFGPLIDTGSEKYYPLYVLNSNNGIQAFKVTPEPASLAALVIVSLLALRRRG